METPELCQKSVRNLNNKVKVIILKSFKKSVMKVISFLKRRRLLLQFQNNPFNTRHKLNRVATKSGRSGISGNIKNQKKLHRKSGGNAKRTFSVKIRELFWSLLDDAFCSVVIIWFFCSICHFRWFMAHFRVF